MSDWSSKAHMGDPTSGVARNLIAASSARLAGASPRTGRASGLVKDLASRIEGLRYDRDPCPHALITWDEVDDPQRPGDPYRRHTRRTESPCSRPGSHGCAEAPAERLHSAESGHVW